MEFLGLDGFSQSGLHLKVAKFNQNLYDTYDQLQ